MKAEIILYVSLVLGIGLLSLSQYHLPNTEDNQTKVIKIDHNSRLKIDLNAKVYVTQGDGQTLVIEGTQKQIDQLKIKEQNNILSISQSRNIALFSQLTLATIPASAELNIYINMEDLSYLDFTNAAQIISSDYQNPMNNTNCVTENTTNFELNTRYFLQSSTYQIIEKLSNELLGAILPDELLCLLRSESGQVCKLA